MTVELRDPGPQPDTYDPDWVHAKYAFERAKRLRRDGLDQFVEVTAEFSHYADDLYTERTERDPVDDEVQVLVIGAGLGSLIAAVRLREAGFDDIRMVDKAGDVGGTWYWNRYPGAQCDVEAYVYMPLLEELDYIPERKYAFGPEIRKHCVRIAEKYDLYRNSLFQTAVTGMEWDDDAGKWTVTTDRGDTITATVVVVSPGPLSRPKLPGIPGINEFTGHTFHTSRWDYGYTGGGEENWELTGLADKTVGIVGTGATALQCVPHTGRFAEQLYVFQRTPAAVDVRGDHPTDPGFAAGLKPGWQKERIENFTHWTSGAGAEVDLVSDGWTKVSNDLTTPAVLREMARRTEPMTMEDIGEFLYEEDFKSMEAVRAHIADVVDDPETAKALTPWYKRMCKRLSFHDSYLQTFNRDNVTLVDTDGRGIERLTTDGVVVGGTEYKVDALIFATGFEVGTNYTKRAGFDIVGRNGIRLSDKWAKGPRTLHGLQTHDFPNCFFLGYTQSGIAPNYVHTAEERAGHLAYLLGRWRELGGGVIEADQDAEEQWCTAMADSTVVGKQFFLDCTPSYLDSEGDNDNPDSLLVAGYGGGPIAFFDILRQWREAGDMAGVSVSGGAPAAPGR
ncbi:cation diffusion facilitator CzcD-associated flavoprotein CzcO [Gordonia amarae]|uniref:Putative Baeyer-Villiger monooxygenase n=1 Tax=Gordonia amarae NBRC 15530 TaxID=1075090 RepID=G7GKC6_9ACTN|nr:NAD(P)/FAD-dependent oxidoreductase [Gordonia amarae]MCS3880452.1 cation diffusion facilitator CzcD-associated flavoprotein CzcO [Gordonia amarae]GAB04051.1 putative Baeyer-Villiger monooxygenase [Gordonia amarae NBRC 15530]